MERQFDRETYLNKDKYDQAVLEEKRRSQDLIDKRVQDLQTEKKYIERKWRFFRNFLKMEIRAAIAESEGVTGEGLEMMHGMADELFDKFLVSLGERSAPGVTDETIARNQLIQEGQL